MMDFWQLILFGVLCGCVFYFDMLFRRVPNSLLIAASVLKCLFLFFPASSNGNFAENWRVAILGMVIAFVIFIPFYAFRAMGAGDVKFFAVVGMWLGPSALLAVFLMGSMLAGAHALVYVLLPEFTVVSILLDMWRASLSAWLMKFATYRWAGDYISARRENRKGIPYAGYMALAAAAFVFLQG